MRDCHREPVHFYHYLLALHVYECYCSISLIPFDLLYLKITCKGKADLKSLFCASTDSSSSVCIVTSRRSSTILSCAIDDGPYTDTTHCFKRAFQSILTSFPQPSSPISSFPTFHRTFASGENYIEPENSAPLMNPMCFWFFRLKSLHDRPLFGSDSPSQNVSTANSFFH